MHTERGLGRADPPSTSPAAASLEPPAPSSPRRCSPLCSWWPWPWPCSWPPKPEATGWWESGELSGLGRRPKQPGGCQQPG